MSWVIITFGIILLFYFLDETFSTKEEDSWSSQEDFLEDREEDEEEEEEEEDKPDRKDEGVLVRLINVGYIFVWAISILIMGMGTYEVVYKEASIFEGIIIFVFGLLFRLVYLLFSWIIDYIFFNGKKNIIESNERFISNIFK